MNVAVVVPTVRPNSIRRWIDEWSGQLGRASQIIIVSDGPEPVIEVSPQMASLGRKQYCWRDIDNEMGEDAWIIPRKTSAIKAYGFLRAYQSGADVIWTLDDDCYPEEGVDYLKCLEQVFSTSVPDRSWWTTLRTGSQPYPRGFPYGVRDRSWPVMVHHGLWSNVPDLDAKTQMIMPHYRTAPATGVDIVPPGTMFPMCGMNLAWKREMTPAFYFMLQGRSWPFDRFDDIWAGLMVKRICDHLGYAVTSGAPSIRHDRASDPVANLRKEAPGLAAHEVFWPIIAEAKLTGTSVGECYQQLADVVYRDVRPALPDYDHYWEKLALAMDAWTTWTRLYGDAP